ncbi:hypothetical protein VN97_g2315 [Penicillium thymicola]|uniref:Uncharacterized protein n=1 Tax=Penicillium thymicola TaxID=293382 RepID=A0AAI9TP90_PENTH|nr:hypothetical protein VN97_g2315 [Penicillium thymicola]
MARVGSASFRRSKLSTSEWSKKKKSLPRGIEPRSPALIGVNDKRKSSPLDQGRCDDRVYCSTTWLVDKGTFTYWLHKPP